MTWNFEHTFFDINSMYWTKQFFYLGSKTNLKNDHVSPVFWKKKFFWVWQPTWCEQKKISKKWFVQNMLLVPKNISAKSENVTIILWGDIFVKRLPAFFSFFSLIIHIISDVINFFGKKSFFLTSFIEIQLCAKAFWKIPIF